KLVWGMYT
ncbi:hypothetical protein D039_3792B, partial [Vibrio parahaemolyticus EKP-028]